MSSGCMSTTTCAARLTDAPLRGGSCSPLKALRIDDLDAEFAEIDEEEAKRAKMREQAKKQYYTGGRVMATQGGFGMGV